MNYLENYIINSIYTKFYRISINFNLKMNFRNIIFLLLIIFSTVSAKPSIKTTTTEITTQSYDNFIGYQATYLSAITYCP